MYNPWDTSKLNEKDWGEIFFLLSIAFLGGMVFCFLLFVVNTENEQKYKQENKQLKELLIKANTQIKNDSSHSRCFRLGK